MSEIKKEVLKNRTRYTLKSHLHREDGPAVEYVDGSTLWYQNGNLHREDGPAIEWIPGDKWWYLNGKKVDFWTVWNLDDDKERKKRLCFHLEEFSK